MLCNAPMKRLVLKRTFARPALHPCRHRRQTVATLYDEETEWQRGERKGFQVNGVVGASGVGDTHSGANGLSSDLDKLAQTEAESSRTPESKKGLADDYNLQKARLHANLWQQEIKKHLGESMSMEENVHCGSREDSGWDPKQIIPEDWESFDPLESHYYDGNPKSEEAMMLEEFEKRRERNRIQIASFVKQHLYGRRRPVDGWKYILNNFGKNERAAGLASSRDGQRQTGNELEKLASKSEGNRFRRKG